uniref:uncharacterized protein LOC105350169 n=1 Tax=Fragaria vesca subsp. vesca TaxID=101020 RepID=UPI0005CA88F2|nr:PREDICTED: uncharacterized protein LOC105350169 [Fragaria vesca subsp. vesca]
MDSQRVVDFDSVKAEKVNAMRRYMWRQNLRWLLKACLPLAPLSYALCLDAPRQLLIAVFNSNLCVFLLLNALVVVTCVLSGENNNSGGGVAERDIYGEYVANVESARRSGRKECELVTPEAEEDLVKGKEVGCFVSRRSMVAGFETETTTLPEEVSNLKGTESYENVNVESLPVCEDKAVTECKTVVSPVSAVTTNTSGCGEEREKVKSYRRTQSESFEKERRKPKKGLERSVTEMHRKTEPESRSSVEDLSDEEFQRQVEAFINSKSPMRSSSGRLKLIINSKKMIQRLEDS